MTSLQTSSSSSSDSEDIPVIRKAKVYRIRENNLDKFDELEFFQRFRIRKRTFLVLLEKIKDNIEPTTNRGGSIKADSQVLLTLRFYATGSMLRAVGDFAGVSIASASRIVRRVSENIAALRSTYIKMPNSVQECEILATEFYRVARFPKVIGAIDCTLIRIQNPGGEDAEIYRTRKQYFGYNVQTVSDPSLKIRDIVARWPGSTHDETIFNNSQLKQHFESGHYGNYFLVGDSGYRLRPYLMTKLMSCTTEAHNLFNESIIRTRNVVERQYGVWKRRFPILSLGMRLQKRTIKAIIVATAVLHNLAILENEGIPEDWIEHAENEEDVGEPVGEQGHGGQDQSGQMTR
ncbi:unnamed protein product, partial [Callosobruchus maculatus]